MMNGTNHLDQIQ